MSGKRISALPAASALVGGDVVPVDQADGTRKATLADIRHLTSLDAGTVFVEPDAGGVVLADLSSALVHLVSAYGGAVEYRLPAASSCPGRVVSVKKTDPSAHSVTVTEAGASGPDNEAIVLSSFGHALICASNGARWHILAVNGVPRDHPQPWSTVTNTPQSLSGYGVASVASGLTMAAALTGAELLVLDQGGAIRKATLADMRRAPPPVAVAWASSVTLDLSGGPDFAIDLARPMRLEAPTGAAAGQSGTLYLTQGAWGGAVPTFGAPWRGRALVASAPGAVSAVPYRVGPGGVVILSGDPSQAARGVLCGLDAPFGLYVTATATSGAIVSLP